MNAMLIRCLPFARVAFLLRSVLPAILLGMGLGAALTLEAQEPHRRLGGANVRVLPQGGGDVRGELIGLDAEHVWVLGRDSILRGVPRGDVRQVRVQRHALSTTQLRRWTATGAGTTGLGLLVACNSVEDAGSCSIFALVWGSVWALVGGLSTFLVSPTLAVPAAAIDNVSAYARFPQGIPEGYAPGIRMEAVP
jgi:hypothetical protein